MSDAPFMPPAPPQPGDDVCTCFDVGASELIALIRTHRPDSLRSLQRHTQAGTVCGGCHPFIAALIVEHVMRE